VEDKRFYDHFGIDFVRIIGAFLKDIEHQAFVEGGSTITQQLAKMLFLSPEKTITRKIKEIFLSLQLERKYSKHEILGIYLNQAYLGTRSYGIEAASQTYFGKSTRHLSIAEAALLSILPKAPSKHSPFADPNTAIRRRNNALTKMRELGFITMQEYDSAIVTALPAKPHARNYKAPYFVDYMRSVLEEKFGGRLYTSGLKIYSSLDYAMQKAAEQAVAGGITALEKRGVSGVQAALIAVDVQTGRIKAMVGGTNYKQTQFNRTTQAMRQPGSAFKPIVYVTALCRGYSPRDIIDDEKFSYIRDEGIWTPQNYGGKYHGKVSLEKALVSSLNAATINLVRSVGITNVIATAKNLGIRSTIRPFDSSALGASEMTLMELVYAYAAFSHGYRVNPVCIDRVIDREKQFVMEPSISREQVIDDAVVADMKSMLGAVMRSGTGRRARVLKRTTYGKTGTTNNYADAWFVGFDETIVAGVWIGRDNRRTIGNKETGARAALPIWIEFMKNIRNGNGLRKTHVAAVR